MRSARRFACLLPRLPQLCSASSSARPPQLSAHFPQPPVLPLPPRRSLLLMRSQMQLQARCITTSASLATTAKAPEEPEEPKKLSLYQRFKQTYKMHGKICIAVHLCTTVCWFTGFYAIIQSGIDVIGWLEWLEVSEKLLGPVRNSSFTNIALTYLMYKLASPVRYAVTIGGTQMVVKQFRKTGRIPELREEDRLRNLAKEGQASMKDMAKDRRENLSQQYHERKADLSQRYKERKEHIRAAARRRLLRARGQRKARKKSSGPEKSP